MHSGIKACIGLGTVDLMFSWQTGVIQLLEGSEAKQTGLVFSGFDFFTIYLLMPIVLERAHKNN